MERKVGVVGAGITGAALAHLLQQEAVKRSLKAVPEVVVWEKNNIAGGRMMARFVECVSLRTSSDRGVLMAFVTQIVPQESIRACRHGRAVFDDVHVR